VHWGVDECIQGFSGETLRKESSCMAKLHGLGAFVYLVNAVTNFRVP